MACLRTKQLSVDYLQLMDILRLNMVVLRNDHYWIDGFLCGGYGCAIQITTLVCECYLIGMCGKYTTTDGTWLDPGGSHGGIFVSDPTRHSSYYYTTHGSPHLGIPQRYLIV